MLYSNDAADMVLFFLLFGGAGLIAIVGFAQIIWYFLTTKITFKLLNFVAAYLLVSSVTIEIITSPHPIQLSYYVPIMIAAGFYLFIWYYFKSVTQKAIKKR